METFCREEKERSSEFRAVLIPLPAFTKPLLQRQHIDKGETYDYIAKKYNSLMLQRQGDLPGRLGGIQSEIADTKRAIENYDRFIRSGNWSETITMSLGIAEERLKELAAQEKYIAAQLENKVYITPHAIKEQMMSLPEILGERSVAANRILRRLFHDKVTMTPKVEGKKKYYEGSGVLNLYSLIKGS